MEEQTEISLTDNQIKRFYNNIKIDDQTGCHIYIGCSDKDGYGRMMIRNEKYGKTIKAHRMAWFLSYGEIPKEICVCHHCDNTSCVNPDHLFLGTIQDNNRDKTNKGRCAQGEGSGQLKIKEQDAITILNIVKEKGQYHGLIKKLAIKYNVGPASIKNIINRTAWKYLKVE